MSFTASMVLQEEHLKYLQKSLSREDGRERAAYVLCGEVVIESDPWDGQQRRKYLSYEILPVPEDEIVSSSERHK
ncbi:MAG: hypothetical protein ACM65L_19610 [Microcoleus sp.]